MSVQPMKQKMLARRPRESSTPVGRQSGQANWRSAPALA